MCLCSYDTQDAVVGVPRIIRSSPACYRLVTIDAVDHRVVVCGTVLMVIILSIYKHDSILLSKCEFLLFSFIGSDLIQELRIRCRLYDI